MTGTDEKPQGVDLVLGKPVTVDMLRQALLNIQPQEALSSPSSSEQAAALRRIVQPLSSSPTDPTPVSGQHHHHMMLSNAVLAL